MENLKECSSNKCYCCFGECWYLENKIFLYKTVSCKLTFLKIKLIISFKYLVFRILIFCLYIFRCMNKTQKSSLDNICVIPYFYLNLHSIFLFFSHWVIRKISKWFTSLCKRLFT